MANIFDQFDDAPAPQNVNTFDQFDEERAPAPARSQSGQRVSVSRLPINATQIITNPVGYIFDRVIGDPFRKAVYLDPKGAGSQGVRSALLGAGDEVYGAGRAVGRFAKQATTPRTRREAMSYVDSAGDVRANYNATDVLEAPSFTEDLRNLGRDAYAAGYQSWRDINRDADEFTNENPLTALTIGVGASLPGGNAVAAPVKSAFAPITKAAANAPKWAQGLAGAANTSAQAGATGYVMGFNQGESFGDRLNRGKSTGVMAAAMPPVVNVAGETVKLTGTVGKGLTKFVTPGNSKQAATMAKNYALADDAGFEITRGQAKQNARIKAREDNLQKTGSGTLQRFADKQADDMQSAGIGKVTRGKAPLTDSVGDAGDVVQAELQAKRAVLEAQADAAYTKAFAEARKEVVPASDQLGVLVQQTIDDGFYDAPRAEGVIKRLEGLIKSGKADFGHVERARQQLNTIASDAYNAGDNATASAARAVRSTLDDWTQQTMTTPAARQTMDGSRQVFSELKGLYAAQSPRDAGGKALERVMDSDITGEQVIGKILGGGKRPNDATLGAVKRIKQIATGTVQSGRVAQRAGATAGAKAFNDPAKQPAKELQAIREALVWRLTAPLRNRAEGALVPAQSIKSNIDDLLDGPARDISDVIFTPAEKDALRQYGDAIELIIPPLGTSKPGTAETLILSKANWADDLKRFVLAQRSTTRPLWATPGYAAVKRRAGNASRAMGGLVNKVTEDLNAAAPFAAPRIASGVTQYEMAQGKGEDDLTPIERYVGGRSALDALLEAQ
jgi:hypothetical protein